MNQAKKNRSTSTWRTAKSKLDVTVSSDLANNFSDYEDDICRCDFTSCYPNSSCYGRTSSVFVVASYFFQFGAIFSMVKS